MEAMTMQAASVLLVPALSECLSMVSQHNEERALVERPKAIKEFAGKVVTPLNGQVIHATRAGITGVRDS